MNWRRVLSRTNALPWGLGHDERAKEAQPVASALGPRFLPWPLEQGVEESWAECQKQAETIEKILGVSKAPEMTEVRPGSEAEAAATPTSTPSGGKTARVVNTEGQALMFAPEPKELPPQLGLFGEVEEKKPAGKKKGMRGEAG